MKPPTVGSGFFHLSQRERRFTAPLQVSFMGGLAGLLGGPLPYERYANLQACPPSIGVDASRSTKSAYAAKAVDRMYPVKVYSVICYHWWKVAP